MRPQTVTVSSATSSAWLPVNFAQEHGTYIGIGCVVNGGGTLTYKVQHTFDDVFDPAVVAAGITAFDHATITGKTANADGNYAFPVRAVRLTVTAYTSGSVTMTLLQA